MCRYLVREPISPVRNYFEDYGPEVLEHIPEFAYGLTDLATMPDKTVRGIGYDFLSRAFFLMKNARTSKIIEENLGWVFKNTLSGSGTLLTEMIVYTITVLHSSLNQFANLVRELSEPLKSDLMSTYDQLIARGEKRGEKRKTRQIVANMLSAGISMEQIVELANVTLYYVRKVKREMEQA